MNENIYQIYANYFTAGIIVKNNYVVKSAPILKWTVGKRIAYIKDYCFKKKWKIIKIN